MTDSYIAFGFPSYVFVLRVPGQFRKCFRKNGVFGGHILYFENPTIFYLFAMLLSSIVLHNIIVYFLALQYANT